MTANPVVVRAASLLRAVNTYLSFLGPLLARLFVAHAFYVTGAGKLENPENVAKFFETLGIPMPAANAWFVSHLEYYGAFLLLLGFLTRPVAAMLGGSMVVAIMTADKDAFMEALTMTGQGDITSVAPLVLLVPLVWLALSGPGLLSLDALIGKLLGVSPAAPPAEPGPGQP